MTRKLDGSSVTYQDHLMQYPHLWRIEWLLHLVGDQILNCNQLEFVRWC